MDWVRILAYITGTVDQELLLRNEYLAAENRLLKAQLKTPLRVGCKNSNERYDIVNIQYYRYSVRTMTHVIQPFHLLSSNSQCE